MQEITEKTVQPLPEGSNLVRPYDKVVVYSTGSTPFSKEGEEMEVHPLLAKKLIASGKARKDKKEAKKEEKKEEK